MTFSSKATKAYKFLCVKVFNYRFNFFKSNIQIFYFLFWPFQSFLSSQSFESVFFSFSSPSSFLFWNGQSPLGKSGPKARITFSGFMSASRSQPHNSSLFWQTLTQLNKFYILQFFQLFSTESCSKLTCLPIYGKWNSKLLWNLQVSRQLLFTNTPEKLLATSNTQQAFIILNAQPYFHRQNFQILVSF